MFFSIYVIIILTSGNHVQGSFTSEYNEHGLVVFSSTNPITRGRFHTWTTALTLILEHRGIEIILKHLYNRVLSDSWMPSPATHVESLEQFAPIYVEIFQVF